MKAPCAKCLKGVLWGKEKTLQFNSATRRFEPVTDPKGDIFQFGPDCYRAILKNGGRKDF